MGGSRVALLSPSGGETADVWLEKFSMPIEKAICRRPIRTVANILKPQPKTFDLFQNRFRKGNQQGFNPFPLPGAAAAAAPAAFPGAASCGSSELPALDGRDFSELDRTTVPLIR